MKEGATGPLSCNQVANIISRLRKRLNQRLQKYETQNLFTSFESVNRQHLVFKGKELQGSGSVIYKIFISCLPLRSKLLSYVGVKDSDDLLTKSSDTYGRAGQFKTEPALFLSRWYFLSPDKPKTGTGSLLSGRTGLHRQTLHYPEARGHLSEY